MIDVLQELVEALAQELGRSVAVDDGGIRLLASSAHFEDVDAARMSSLVGRRVSGEIREYVMRAGVQNWHKPTVLPANPALGLDRDRLGFPLRSRYELLGFMWLLDDGTLKADEVDLAKDTAHRIQELLALRTQSEHDADDEIESLVLALAADEARSREQAAEELRDKGLFLRTDFFSVVAVSAKPNPGRLAESITRDTIRRGFAAAIQGHLRELYAYSIGDKQSFLVIGHRTKPSHAQMMAAGRAVEDAISRSAPASPLMVTIGTSQIVDQLSRVHEAMDQALSACEVARASGQASAAWGDAPLDALLSSWLRTSLDCHLVPPSIEKLMQQPVETIEIVEAYLDAGSNVAIVANALHLHRTTVYYRLNRLKMSTGIDLQDGDTRLLVHLWLKGRRFSSVTPRS